jgi:hypothetical protein
MFQCRVENPSDLHETKPVYTDVQKNLAHVTYELLLFYRRGRRVPAGPAGPCPRERMLESHAGTDEPPRRLPEKRQELCYAYE